MKPVTEQIKEWEAKRQAKAAQRDTIMDKAAEESRTLDAAEGEAHDTLAGELEGIDKHLTRLYATQKEMASQAKAVGNHNSVDLGSRERAQGSGIQVMEPKLEKGIGFARLVKCIALAKFDDMPALELAKHFYPNYAPLHEILKAPMVAKTIGAGTTEASTWAAPLVNYQILAQEFIDFLRPRTIIGQFGVGNVPSFRRVPFKVKVPRMTSGTSGYWVGQGKPKPLSNGAMDSVTLDFSKVAAISVITDELARLSTPSAELIVRDDLAAAVIQRIDTDFVDPTLASSANVHPAAITYGAMTAVSSGDDAAAVRTDIKALLAPMIQANIPIGNIVLIMNENTALGLSLMQTSLGIDSFPGMTPTGGILLGHPVVVSQYVGSALVIAVAPNEVMLADDGNVSIDVSREASLEMVTGSMVQDGTVGTGTSLVSMWQNNMLAIRAEREINWALRRAAAVTYLTSANWGGGANSGDI